MKLEPISREMFDVLYDIFYQNKRSNKVEEYNKEKSFQEAKERGLIKKTALEELEIFYNCLRLKYSLPGDDVPCKDVVELYGYFVRAMAEWKGETPEC